MTQLISANEAAKILGISPNTLAVWRCTRRYPLRYVLVGKSVKYRPSDLEQFIESRTRSGVGDEQTGRARRKYVRRLRSGD